MPLGTEINVGPGHMLDGSHPKRGTAAPPPTFDSCILWPSGGIDQNAPLGTEVCLGPGDIVLDGDPPFQLPSKRGRAALPTFYLCQL